MAESSSDSDSSFDEPKRKKGRPGRKNSGVIGVNEENGFKCNNCGKQFTSKSSVYRHVSGRTCLRRPSLKCKWCNLEFANSGNLATHAKNMHGDNSYKRETTGPTVHKCHVCERVFSHKFKLCYHIRRIHFNLQAKIPHATLKQVNQVWFERVLNSNIIVEIKKTGQNSLVIRKLNENTNIKVSDNTNTIDLSSVYPVSKRFEDKRIDCEICKRSYVKRDYKKHVQEIHLKSVKHHCNNCNRSFKRSYQYLHHICNKARRLKGVIHNSRNQHDVRITSVQSLAIPLG